MTPEQYHQVLIGLDRALFVFHEAVPELDERDAKLIERLTAIRADVIQLGSGHPFRLLPPNKEEQEDSEITRVPWR
jgi:hypothetical protein